MHKILYHMEFDPFEPHQPKTPIFEHPDFIQVSRRLEQLQTMRGIGLLTGNPGCGKTTVIRNWAQNLNPALFRVMYCPMSSITTIEFYRSICIALGLEVRFKKIDMFRDIQNRIRSLAVEKKITPVFILDEAQYLRTDILSDIKLLLNFDMDSQSFAVLMLVGLPILSSILERKMHEALAQRIVVNYSLQGIQKSDLVSYIEQALTACGACASLFEPAALEALFSASQGIFRRANSLASKALLFAASNKLPQVTSEAIFAAADDMVLF